MKACFCILQQECQSEQKSEGWAKPRELQPELSGSCWSSPLERCLCAAPGGKCCWNGGLPAFGAFCCSRYTQQPLPAPWHTGVCHQKARDISDLLRNQRDQVRDFHLYILNLSHGVGLLRLFYDSLSFFSPVYEEWPKMKDESREQNHSPLKQTKLFDGVQKAIKFLK